MENATFSYGLVQSIFGRDTNSLDDAASWSSMHLLIVLLPLHVFVSFHEHFLKKQHKFIRSNKTFQLINIKCAVKILLLFCVENIVNIWIARVIQLSYPLARDQCYLIRLAPPPPRHPLHRLRAQSRPRPPVPDSQIQYVNTLQV